MATLRQLRYLQALVRYRHFGRAAEACAISQPALSMQIRDLEKELGVELVERRPGEAALTDVGLEVARARERVLPAPRELDAIMRALPLPDAEIEPIRLFDDAFLLAVPADDPLPRSARVNPRE